MLFEAEAQPRTHHRYYTNLPEDTAPLCSLIGSYRIAWQHDFYQLARTIQLAEVMGNTEVSKVPDVLWTSDTF